tara:strand:+ start:1309 stop:2763 length:1455 start_codon:yes stop_codon:yes gene_type:complete
MEYERVLGLLTLICLAGCGTTMEIKRFSPGTEKIEPGIVFFLPKSEIELTYTYTIYKKTIWTTDSTGKKVDIKDEDYLVSVDNDINFDLKTIADHENSFIYDIKSLRSGAKDTDTTIKLNDKYILTSFNTSTTDKLSSAIKGTLETVANIAKVAAVGGADIVELIKFKEIPLKKIVDIEWLLEVCIAQKKSDAVKSCHVDIDVDVSDIVITHPQRMKGQDNIVIFDNSKLPKVSFDIEFDKAESAKVRLAAQKVLWQKTTTLDGLPYLIPKRLDAVISLSDPIDGTSKTTARKQTAFSILQLGDVAYIPIGSETFDSSSQVLTFNETTGQLTEYQDNSDASTTKALETASEATGTILSTIESLQTYKLEREKAISGAKVTLKENNDKLETTETEALTEELSKLQKTKEVIAAQNSLNEVEALNDKNSYAFKLKTLKDEIALVEENNKKIKVEKLASNIAEIEYLTLVKQIADLKKALDNAGIKY